MRSSREGGWTFLPPLVRQRAAPAAPEASTAPASPADRVAAGWGAADHAAGCAVGRQQDGAACRSCRRGDAPSSRLFSGCGCASVLAPAAASAQNDAADDHQTRWCRTSASAAGSPPPARRSLSTDGTAVCQCGIRTQTAGTCSPARAQNGQGQIVSGGRSHAPRRARRARRSALSVLSIAILATLAGTAVSTEINTAVSIFGPWDYELRKDGTSRCAPCCGITISVLSQSIAF